MKFPRRALLRLDGRGVAHGTAGVVKPHRRATAILRALSGGRRWWRECCRETLGSAGERYGSGSEATACCENSAWFCEARVRWQA